jgi:hypothetical protein
MLGLELFLVLAALVIGAQFSTAHVRVEGGSGDVLSRHGERLRLVVYRGLRALHGLPAPINSSPLYDAGYAEEPLRSGVYEEIRGLILWSWEGAGGKEAQRLHQALSEERGLKHRGRPCYLTPWPDTIRCLAEREPSLAAHMVETRGDVKSQILKDLKTSNS